MPKELIKRLDKKALLSDKSRSEVIKESLISTLFAEIEQPVSTEESRNNRLIRLFKEVETLKGEEEAERKLFMTRKHGSYGSKNMMQGIIETMIQGDPSVAEIINELEVRSMMEAKHRHIDPTKALDEITLHLTKEYLDGMQVYLHRKNTGATPRIELNE